MEVTSVEVNNSLITRDTVVIAVFGALWGVMEITLGAFLKGLRIPMGGAFLTALSVIIFLIGGYFVKRRGAILMMGMVAAFLKVVSVGTVIAGPFMAILIEALIGEGLILLLGTGRVRFAIIGMLLLIYVILHPLVSQGLIFGSGIYQIYLETFRGIAALFNLNLKYLLWIISAYVGLHAMLGAGAGLFAFSLCKSIEYQLHFERIAKSEVK